MENRTWMYDMYLSGGRGLKPEFYEGVDKFIEFASSQPNYMDEAKVKCPCTKCVNCHFRLVDEVKNHLYKRGFMMDYYNWTAHGEPVKEFVPPSYQIGNQWGTYDELPAEQRMVFDIAGPGFVPPSWFTVGHDHVEGGFQPDDIVDEVDEMREDPPIAVDDVFSMRFANVLRAADEPLYDEVLPAGHKIPTSYYETEKVVRSLGLPVERISMCPNGCMLYWKDDANEDSCKFSSHARYADASKCKPHKVLFYLPLTPRLQRLYASEATASHMTWHACHQPDIGMMSHPSDRDAWKRLDEKHYDFAYEPRNVRLGLCTDGFVTFNKSGQNYSSWPVIVTPYNLPPSMCMRTEYMFLSLIVSGPRNPKRLIDVCLQPLIEELLQLWTYGVSTYDVSRRENFIMRAALLWTISDFPAYAMLSGWSTAGELACPICMERGGDAFRLQNGKKACWFDCHRKFLEVGHPWRRNKNDFYRGHVETQLPPPLLTGEQIWERVHHFKTAIEDPLQKPPGFGVSHKWTKQSIFWRLPYWKDLLIRHNLDVMHIEKNVFDNVFNTVMDVPGKTKDNLNARRDLKLYCVRPDLEVDDGHSGSKTKAIYTLRREDKKKVGQWLRSVKFPDGYASNVGKCVQSDDCSLLGMKSHDCHVFMERLLPIVFKELLDPSVWGPLTELSILFQTICSSTLSVNHMVQLGSMVPLLICKLERIFPPSFFDSMEHLLVHLPYEAQVSGPVQYRWMYPFERNLFHLKRMIVQKNHVEGSICMAYLREEVANFSVHYFPSHLPSKLRRPARNEMFGCNVEPISIFNYPGRSSGKGKTRWMIEDKEWNAAHTYVLLNCPEVQPYIEVFQNEMGTDGGDDVIEQEFATWFKNYVLTEGNGVHIHELLWSLAWGPNGKAISRHGYYVNGYKFHTEEHSTGKSTMNSGVCVKGSNYTSAESDFFGVLEEILELEYPSSPERPLKVVLFRCRWFDPTPRGSRVHPVYQFVEVNHKKLYRRYEPFVLAQQAVQVYYLAYPGARRDRVDWWHVCRTSPRSRIERRWGSNEPHGQDAYQSDEVVTPDVAVHINDNEGPSALHDPSGTFDVCGEGVGGLESEGEDGDLDINPIDDSE